MLGPGSTPIDLEFEGPDDRVWSDAALVVVSNNPYQVTRFAGVGTRPSLDTGRLGILAAHMKSARTVAKLVTLGTIGQAQRFQGLCQWSSPEFEVRSDAPVAVGLDGEPFVLVPPLRFVSLPGALRVRMSRQAAGVSPAEAAVSLTRRDLNRLFRIAAGTDKPSQDSAPESQPRGR